MNIGEYATRLEEINRLQSELIDALFLEVLQHKEVDELEGSKAGQLIKEVAEKRREIGI